MGLFSQMGTAKQEADRLAALRGHSLDRWRDANELSRTKTMIALCAYCGAQARADKNGRAWGDALEKSCQKGPGL